MVINEIGYHKRSNVRSKASSGSQNYSNYESSKINSFKILNKSLPKNKAKERMSHSGSNKAGRPTTGYIPSK